MWRVVNFRCFLITAAFCIFTTLLSRFLNFSASLVVVLAAVSVLITFTIIAARQAKPIVAASLLLSLVVVVACFSGVSYTKKDWTSELQPDREYAFSGKITSVSITSGETTSYLVDNLTADGVAIKGKINLYVTRAEGALATFLRSGDIIEFSADAEFNELSADSDGYVYRNDVRYYVRVAETDVKFVNAHPDFFQSLRNKMFSALTANMGAHYGSIAYGLITGEKGGIDATVRNYYSATGLGHILAVSGLHIGFVAVAINLILRLFRAGRKARLFITAPVLLFYCALAGFSPSVVRATIMCIVALSADAFGRQRDSLNALSLALTAILMIKPYYLFDVGFQMSMSAVFGILMFSRILGQAFGRFLPKFLASALSVSVGVQIGITPVMLIVFGTFPLYSVLTNLVVIPIVSVTFIALTFALILTLIWSPLGIVLGFSGAGLALVDDIARLVSALPLSEIRIYAHAFMYLAYLLLFIAGGYFMLPRLKSLAVIICFVLIGVGLGVSNIPLSSSLNYITVGAYKDVSAVVRLGGKTMIVGDATRANSLESMLEATKARRVDAVYVNALNPDAANAIVALSEEYPITKVYFPLSEDMSGMYELIDADIEIIGFNELTELQTGLKCAYNDGFLGYLISDGEVTLLQLGYGKSVSMVSDNILSTCAFVRSYSDRNSADCDRLRIVSYAVSGDADAFVTGSSIFALDLRHGRAKILD